MEALTSIEICAGAGGQALGLEQAGFEHVALVEIETSACNTLRRNRPKWKVIEGDVKEFSAAAYVGIDLLAGGVPCPPFSKAGKQLGGDDERDLFPTALRLVAEAMPKAVMLENVRGIFDPSFTDYRTSIIAEFRRLNYAVHWKILNASDYGLPQLRPRAVLVALQSDIAPFFDWPNASLEAAPSVADAVGDLMAAKGWTGLADWLRTANRIAPTIVGGSKKHGGPDLGPTRARKTWSTLGVDGSSIADEPPDVNFSGMPKLTIPMVARLQGFPDSWEITGKKTPAYRQLGNAFPPPVARAVGDSIARAIVRGRLFSENSDTVWEVKQIAQKISFVSTS